MPAAAVIPYGQINLWKKNGSLLHKVELEAEGL